MRKLAFALVPLFLGGCSIPQEMAAQDPAAAPTSLATTKGDAITEAKTLRFSWGVSHEHSCSRSFEDISKSGDFTLELTPPHAAKLTRTMLETETLGAWPEMGKKPTPPATYERARREDVFAGRVDRVGDALRLELVGGSTGDGKLSMTCAPAKVKVVVYDDGKAETETDVLRCTPSFGLPDALHEAQWGGGLVFAEKTIRAVYESKDSFSSFDVGPELHFGY